MSSTMICPMKIVPYFPFIKIVMVQFSPTILNHTSGMYAYIYIF